MYYLDYFMIVHSVGEGEEVLNVEGIIVQVLHWVLDGDVPLSRMSVRSGQGTVNINYKIQVMRRGFMSSD